MRKILYILLLLTSSVYGQHNALIARFKFEVDPATNVLGTNWFTKDASIRPFLSINHYCAQYRNGKTYIVYSSENLNPFLVYYDHSNSTWSTPLQLAINPLTNDIHGSPAIFFDKSGYCYVFFGSHNTSQQYVRSNSANNVTTFTQYSFGTDVTYPQPLIMSDGTIYVFYRNANHGWSYITSTNGIAWGTSVDVLYGDVVEGHVSLTYASFIKGRGDTVHATFLKSFGANVYEEYNSYYMYRDVSGNWKNITGTTLTTPLSVSDADSYCLVRNTGVNHVNNSVMIKCDTINNKPIVVLLEGEASESVNNTYKIATWNGSSWVTTSICNTDNLYDLYDVDVKTPTNYDIYLEHHGTTGTGDVYNDMGGNIEKWSTTNSGATWDSILTINPISPGHVCRDPNLVQNGLASAKLVYADYTIWNDYSNFRLKAYLWGNGNFVQAPYPNFKITNVNSLSKTTGKLGSCYNFNGNYQYYLYVKDQDTLSFVPNKPFSISFWLKAAGTSTQQYLISKNWSLTKEYQIYINGNVLYCIHYGSTASIYKYVSSPYTSTAWNFITVTDDGSTSESGMKIYINGVESETVLNHVGTYVSCKNTTAMLYFGTSYGTGYGFNGQMDEVIFWDKVLSIEDQKRVMSGFMPL
jgi:hypothetical protein